MSRARVRVCCWTIVLKSNSFRPSLCHHLSDSRLGMHSSPMHNAESSTRLQCLIISRSLGQSVSLVESCTLITELISTLSSTSDRNTVRGTHASLMSRDATLTLNNLEASRGLATTMQSRTATLLQVDWRDPVNQVELDFHLLMTNGLRLHRQRLLTSFGNYLESWILVRWYDLSLSAELMRSIVTECHVTPTALRQGLLSTQAEWMNCLHGSQKICEDTLLEVCLDRRSGCSRQGSMATTSFLGTPQRLPSRPPVPDSELC